MAKDNNKIVVRATKEGKLYIKSEDFFKQPKVIDILKKLQNSSVTKEIDKKAREVEAV